MTNISVAPAKRLSRAQVVLHNINHKSNQEKLNALLLHL
jgi:hypothetical protein